MSTQKSVQVISINRQARFHYHLGKEYRTGMVLLGPEVKSLRDKRISFVDSYVHFKQGQLVVEKMHISPYPHAYWDQPDPNRSRILLVNQQQKEQLKKALEKKGATLVPTKLLLVGSYFKLDIALAWGKKLYDKRNALKEKTQNREVARNLKIQNR